MSLCAPLASSDSVETLFDILAGSCRVADLTFEVKKTSAGIPCHGCFDTLAAQALYELLDILLIETVDHGGFVATLEQDIRFRTKVTLYIHLSFEELEDVSLISIKLLAEHVEVRD